MTSPATIDVSMIDPVVKRASKKLLSKVDSVREIGSLEDIYQVGWLAVLKSLSQFEPKKCKFEKYVFYKAWFGILDEARCAGLIKNKRRIDREAVGSPKTYEVAKAGFRKKCRGCGRYCHNPARKCPHCGNRFAEERLDQKRRCRAFSYQQYAAEIGKPVGELFGSNRNDLIHVDNREIVDKFLAILDDRERFLVRHYFGLDGFEEKNTIQIAPLIGRSVSRVFVLLMRSLEKGKSLED